MMIAILMMAVVVMAVIGNCHLPVAIFQAPYGRWAWAHVFVLICQRL